MEKPKIEKPKIEDDLDHDICPGCGSGLVNGKCMNCHVCWKCGG